MTGMEVWVNGGVVMRDGGTYSELVKIKKSTHDFCHLEVAKSKSQIPEKSEPSLDVLNKTNITSTNYDKIRFMWLRAPFQDGEIHHSIHHSVFPLSSLQEFPCLQVTTWSPALQTDAYEGPQESSATNQSWPMLCHYFTIEYEHV